ncbi:MAG: GNAT family N-acetyltransferase [Dokdonella sp.]|uniref:GNAT family N-acetyltransferase n=1 Tax=Dokdonella sp. TaxID=2291710 RepID=UPI002CF9DB72|nr:GNAT family N-acetyltransferase [Dokdonella sp.]HOX71554.1 GNAT family N-acetyltransferase [Dokdonella sp.]HPN80859.1 GNAT family N-acetyltransferase [Dokdonella sp.]
MDTGNLRIETSRLILRPVALEDFDAWADFMADAQTMQFLGGAQPRAVAWRALMTMAGAWQLHGFAMFSVIEKDSGRWIGRLGPWMPDGWPGTEVGWSIVREAWGKGYGTEGATAAIDWSFDTLGWTEVIHTISAENLASKALAATLGSRFLRMGRLPAPVDIDVEIWGQTREQWKARQTKGVNR